MKRRFYEQFYLPFGVHMFLFLLNKYLGVELLAHEVYVHSTFRKSEIFVLFYTPTSDIWEFELLQHLMLSVFYFSHSSRCVMIFHYGLNLLFLDEWYENFFIHLLAILHIFFKQKCGKCKLSFWIFCPFLNHLVCLIIRLWKFFTYSRSKTFARYAYYEYFLLVCDLPIYFLKKCFGGTNIFFIFN